MKRHIEKLWRNFVLSQRVILICLVILSMGCASPYKGPKPDLSLAGDMAEKEIERFTMSSANKYGKLEVRLGGDNQAYTLDSVAPIIEEVSPAAYKSYLRTQEAHRRTLFNVLVGLGLIALAASYSSQFGTEIFLNGYGYMFVGVSIGLIYSRSYVFDSMLDQYNEDLRNRATPQLSLSVGFD